MELGKKIQQILRHYPSVYVSGLGVFHQIHRPSTYDEKRRVYLPPLDYIEFDGASIEGVSFVDYVSRESSISRSEAEEQLRNKVDELINALHEYGQVTIEQLGELIRYGDGFVFKALDLSAFTLTPVEYAGQNPWMNGDKPSVATEVSSTSVHGGPKDAYPVDVDQDETPEGIFNAEEAVQQAPPTLIPEDDVPQPTSVPAQHMVHDEEPKSSSRIWYIVLAVVGLSIAGVLWYMNTAQHIGNSELPPAPENSTGGDQTAAGPIVTPDTTASTDTLQSPRPQDSVLTGNSQPAEVRETPVATPVIPADHTWYIVVASRLPVADAVAFQEKWNKKGQTSVRIFPNKSNSAIANVIWNSYRTKEQADSALRHVRKNFVPDAWHTSVKK